MWIFHGDRFPLRSLRCYYLTEIYLTALIPLNSFLCSIYMFRFYICSHDGTGVVTRQTWASVRVQYACEAHDHFGKHALCC